MDCRRPLMAARSLPKLIELSTKQDAPAVERPGIQADDSPESGRGVAGS
jgi:hypothetical protein